MPLVVVRDRLTSNTLLRCKLELLEIPPRLSVPKRHPRVICHMPFHLEKSELRGVDTARREENCLQSKLGSRCSSSAIWEINEEMSPGTKIWPRTIFICFSTDWGHPFSHTYILLLKSIPSPNSSQGNRLEEMVCECRDLYYVQPENSCGIRFVLWKPTFLVLSWLLNCSKNNNKTTTVVLIVLSVGLR